MHAHILLNLRSYVHLKEMAHFSAQSQFLSSFRFTLDEVMKEGNLK